MKEVAVDILDDKTFAFARSKDLTNDLIDTVFVFHGKNGAPPLSGRIEVPVLRP